MSIATYTDLLSAVAGWLNRDDLTARIPDFVALFEGRAKRELRDWLRTTLTATNTTGDLVLSDSGEVLSVSYNDGTSGAHNFPLDLVSREQYNRLMETQSANVSVAGQVAYVDADVNAGTTTIRFWPPAGATAPIANLKVEYVKQLQSLASVSTNALLRDAPDMYLYGTLAESAPYLLHDERVPVWQARVDEGFRGLRILTERRLYGGAPRPRQLSRVFG